MWELGANGGAVAHNRKGHLWTARMTELRPNRYRLGDLPGTPTQRPFADTPDPGEITSFEIPRVLRAGTIIPPTSPVPHSAIRPTDSEITGDKSKPGTLMNIPPLASSDNGLRQRHRTGHPQPHNLPAETWEKNKGLFWLARNIRQTLDTGLHARPLQGSGLPGCRSSSCSQRELKLKSRT